MAMMGFSFFCVTVDERLIIEGRLISPYWSWDSVESPFDEFLVDMPFLAEPFDSSLSLVEAAEFTVSILPVLTLGT